MRTVPSPRKTRSKKSIPTKRVVDAQQWLARDLRFATRDLRELLANIDGHLGDIDALARRVARLGGGR